ncbi:hypothetical protein GLIP_0620 [Aliiglaciecola lipolytica E3]|uniref:Uncharacterized protein n=1 Tax=Aliiglaciecola lipolytica E3 TaxID=1127673 RepID=K6XNL0_9ALTE|nr:hypothetical protein GLIP_0620 [Aliiglaciecola lipolytica E3]
MHSLHSHYFDAHSLKKALFLSSRILNYPKQYDKHPNFS